MLLVPGGQENGNRMQFSESLHLLFNLFQIAPAVVEAVSKQRLKIGMVYLRHLGLPLPPCWMCSFCYLAFIWPLFVKNIREKPWIYVISLWFPFWVFFFFFIRIPCVILLKPRADELHILSHFLTTVVWPTLNTRIFTPTSDSLFHLGRNEQANLHLNLEMWIFDLLQLNPGALSLQWEHKRTVQGTKKRWGVMTWWSRTIVHCLYFCLLSHPTGMYFQSNPINELGFLLPYAFFFLPGQC